MRNDDNLRPAVIVAPDGRVLGKIQVQPGRLNAVSKELSLLLGEGWQAFCEEKLDEVSG